MSNLNVPADQWLAKLFECEYCSECGGDADDHTAIPVEGNWFALCNHPLPDDFPEDQIEKELVRRHALQQFGLPINFEAFPHDNCPKCGTPSVPGEKVPDQSLRYCVSCEHQWFEDLDRPPSVATD